MRMGKGQQQNVLNSEVIANPGDCKLANNKPRKSNVVQLLTSLITRIHYCKHPHYTYTQDPSFKAVHLFENSSLK